MREEGRITMTAARTLNVLKRHLDDIGRTTVRDIAEKA